MSQATYYVDFTAQKGKAVLVVAHEQDGKFVDGYIERLAAEECIFSDKMEFRAVIRALQLATIQGHTMIIVQTDSHNVVAACAKAVLPQRHTCFDSHGTFLLLKAGFEEVRVELVARGDNPAHVRARSALAAIFNPVVRKIKVGLVEEE